MSASLVKNRAGLFCGRFKDLKLTELYLFYIYIYFAALFCVYGDF